MSRLLACLSCALLVASPVVAAGVEAYAPALKWVVLAPSGSGAVQVLDVSRGVTPLATLRSTRRGKVRALHVQQAGRRVWVLAENGLDVHDAFSGRLLAHWDAPEGVRLERLVADGGGRPVAWSANRRFEALIGAPFLLPADGVLASKR